MRRPFDQAHRIPFGLQQCLQIPLQARIRHRCLLPPTPGLADPPLRSDSFSREFFDPSLDRLPIRSRARCYLTDTTRADLERFCSQIQAPLLLIQFVPQDLVLLLCRHSLTIPYFPVFWKLFADEPLGQPRGKMEQSLKCALSRFRAALEEDGAQPYLERLERARGRRPAEAIHADWPRVGSVLREEPRNKGGC